MKTVAEKRKGRFTAHKRKVKRALKQEMESKAMYG
jgi:hypothetical protein